jgi:hypothetical protein
MSQKKIYTRFHSQFTIFAKAINHFKQFRLEITFNKGEETMEMTRSPLTKLAVLFFATAMLLATVLTLSCSGDGGGGSNSIKKERISGVSQKGPFVKGSSATLYELNEEFAQTGMAWVDAVLQMKAT